MRKNEGGEKGDNRESGKAKRKENKKKDEKVRADKGRER